MPATTDLMTAAASGLQKLPNFPRLPVVPDVLRRIRVPDDLDAVTVRGPEADPEAVGISRDAVERMWDAALGVYRSGAHPALQLCVRRHGEVILDRAIGHARGNGPADAEDAEKVQVETDTPFVIFSASKAMTALVVHLLDEQGFLHIADPVVEYVPEFAKHGKEAITLAQVLSHRAGIPNISAEAVDLDSLADPEFLTQLVADTEPVSRPGKLLAYHAVSGGFILGEVVRRVTGKDLPEVIAEQVLEPLGFRWTNYGVSEGDLDAVGRSYNTGAPLLPPLSTQLTKVLSRPVDEVTELSNDRRFLLGVVPSANVVSTANELSRFFELMRCGGELDGVRVCEPRTLRRALTEQSYLEVDRSLGFPTRFSYGFMLGAEHLSLFGPDTERAFGHLGFTNILGWSDPERAVSVGLMTSGKPVLYPELPRFWAVGVTIGKEAPKVERRPADDPLDARSR